jgi:hypothetical protein
MERPMHDQKHPPTSELNAELADVVPFRTLPAKYPNIFVKPGTALWLLRNRRTNGLAAIIHFVGKQAFISQREFEAWFRGRPAERVAPSTPPSPVTRAGSRRGKEG